MLSFDEFNNPKINFRRLDIIKGVEQLDKIFVDLASSNLNGKVIECSDEFFAEASNLLKSQKPVREWGRYTERGAWMDGWESKRHNPTYDWVVIKLGFEGHLAGFDIDTAHFVGNQAPLADVEACYSPHKDPLHNDDTNWHKVLPKVDLEPNSQHFFEIQKTTLKFTHVRLNIYPDGGVARFRVYGVVSAKWPKDLSKPLDLAYVGNEGRIISYSDQHFGKSDNILLPGRGKDMSDGWETKRSRHPNHKDWIIIKLGTSGYLEKAEVDTAFFKGNYPDSVLLEACFCDKDMLLEGGGSNMGWNVILEKSKLGPHEQHYFDLKEKNKKFSHVKMTIFPDGGVKRLRIIGRRELPKNGVTQSDTTYPSDISPTRIAATPLTYASYSPYGHIIQSFPEHSSTSQNSISIIRNIKVTSANQGTARKYNHIAPIINYRQTNILLKNQSSNSSDKARMIAKAEPNLSLYKCSPVKSFPFTLRLLERHPYTSQMFVPLNNGKVKGYLVVVCLSNEEGDKPDLSTLNAFVVSSIQGISYHPGVWHHPMIALGENTDFVCLTHESGVANEDCEEIKLEEKDFIVIDDIPEFN